MNEHDFEANIDWRAIAEIPLEKIQENLKNLEFIFRNNEFHCASLEEYAKKEDVCSGVSFCEYPTFANDNEFLSKWFSTVAVLQDGAWLLLNEIRNRKLAFTPNNLNYFQRIGIHYDVDLSELRRVALIAQSENPKYCDELSEFASKGLDYNRWQSQLLKAFVMTISKYVQNQRTLERFKKVMQNGIVKGIKILVPDFDICEECSKLHHEKIYGISDIDTIPSLPLHWGCCCIYNSTFK